MDFKIKIEINMPDYHDNTLTLYNDDRIYMVVDRDEERKKTSKLMMIFIKMPNL